MGIVHSSDYQRLDGKPLVAPLSHVWDSGEEWVRFLDTTWTDVRASTPNSAGNAVYTGKAIKVQGQSTSEIYYLSRESLLQALDGDLRLASKFVSRKKDHDLHVKWTLGSVTDPQTGRIRDSSFVIPSPDPDTGVLLRKRLAVDVLMQ